MTDWQSIKTIPNTSDKILVVGPNGYMEVRKASTLKAQFERIAGSLDNLDGFWWAPVSPPPMAERRQ